MAINDPTRIREFISFGLGKYSTEVTSIIENIWAKGYDVSASIYADDTSTTVWEKSWVRIRIFNERKDLYIIWDLLHEYGHILDGPPPPLTLEVRQLREISAWKRAEEELKSYPQLLLHRDEFIRYRDDECLKTYGLSSPDKV